jgi:membrane protein implicated in regulation of membrane protease activity
LKLKKVFCKRVSLWPGGVEFIYVVTHSIVSNPSQSLGRMAMSLPQLQSANTANPFGIGQRNQIAYVDEQTGPIYWLKHKGTLWQGMPQSSQQFLPGEMVTIMGRQGNRLLFREFPHSS